MILLITLYTFRSLVKIRAFFGAGRNPDFRNTAGSIPGPGTYAEEAAVSGTQGKGGKIILQKAGKLWYIKRESSEYRDAG